MKEIKVKAFMFKVILITLLVLNFPIKVEAGDYTANDWDTFKNRTKEQIGAQYSNAVNAGSTYRNGDSNTYYKKSPSLQSPYTEGELSSDTLEAMTALSNYYRWLEGTSPVKLASSSSDLQAGALVRKWNFNHSIPISSKPSDMSDEFWYKGANVSHNILARGYSPRGAITGWLDEGYDLRSNTFDTIGHRTAILSISASKLNYGYAGSVAIGKIAESSNTTDLPFVSFPVPGYMPDNILYSQTSSWHIELNRNMITPGNYTGVKVVVTNLKTNQSYECTTANGKLEAYSYIMNFVQPQAESNRYYENGEKFKVEVTGLTEKATGKAITLSYTTEFFDVSDYVTSTRAVEAKTKDGWTNLYVGTENSTAERLNKIAKILPTTISIETETNRTGTAKIKGNWKLDQANKCWTATIDKSTLSSFVTDPDGILNSVKINYKVGESYVNRYLYVSNQNPNIGSSIYFDMWTYMLTPNANYEIYQVTNQSTKLRIKENYNTVKYVNGWYRFDLNSIKASDTGTYVGIYYSGNPSYSADAHLAGMLDVDVKSIPFTDVKKSDWFYNAVEYVFSNNIIKGYNETTFAPNDQLTRGMLVTILHRMEGSPKVTGNTKFLDVQNPKEYYYNAIKWALDNKIVSGYNNEKFGPNDNITREQLAVILCKYAKYKGKSTSQTNNLSAFLDRNKISRYAIEQVKWAVGAGVITGNKNGTLNPTGTATRAEASAMLEKYCRNIGR